LRSSFRSSPEFQSTLKQDNEFAVAADYQLNTLFASHRALAGAALKNCSEAAPAPGFCARLDSLQVSCSDLRSRRKGRIMFEGLFQPMHLLVIFGIALLVFGPKKLPELGKGLGDGIRGFKSAIKQEAEPEKPNASSEKC